MKFILRNLLPNNISIAFRRHQRIEPQYRLLVLLGFSACDVHAIVAVARDHVSFSANERMALEAQASRVMGDVPLTRDALLYHE
ncbi:hypothetical protein TcBrA4_0000330 [Trypanosoma cruzi]|nr:hypothetical protein TcBrA4_0000330 [Trypanosoma cruzi]